MSLPSLKSQFSQLISLPSISSVSPEWDQGNLNVINQLAEWLTGLGFDCDVRPLASNPNKANLVAVLGGGPGGLVLAGHTDTVPYDEGKWNSDPFKLMEQDNRFYGLGTCDMKGFFPLLIEAVTAFDKRDFKQPLIVLATADEESSMNGAREIAANGAPLARYAVIGEPTGLRPIRMHKGIMMESIRVQGQSGHSSNPTLGNNALDAMHHVMVDLLDFRTELQAQNSNPAFKTAVPTLNLGHIHGGDNPNRICGYCELQFDVRLLPGMCNETIRNALKQRLRRLSEQQNIEIQLQSLIHGVAAFSEPADSELVTMAEKLSGHSAEAVAFATEAPFLQQLGMQTIVLGPGSIDQAHQPDEFIELRQIDPCVKLLQQFIQRICL
ncbi:MAG: acetylornithine deacetylase [Pseudomonadales bacterium]